MFQRYITPPALKGLALILLKCETLMKVFFLYSAVSFHFFFIYLLSLLKTVKLEPKFLFGCHVDRLASMCSLVRPANYLPSIWRLLVNAYLSQPPNQIFKYLGFDCQVKLNFFIDCSFEH